ncbi:MAG: hypothetical protein F4022_14920, partial [Gemmatimonadetes bacterium]|nr:hypothetical protein [Gemmatimonadota bacterium]
MKAKRARYRERTWAPMWAWLTLGTAFLLSVGRLSYELYGIAVLGGTPADGSARELALITGGLIVLFALIIAVWMCLNVEVCSDHIFISFGVVQLVRKRIWYKDIEGVRPTTYRPLRDFGGWGIRWRGNRTAWTIRGHQAVAVKLHGGREIYVGSMYPQRLAGAIQAAMRTAGAG